MIQVECLGISYREANAVNEFSESIAAGEWLCLIGPNGAGKSSVLRGIAALTRFHGRVLVGGTDVSQQSPRWRARNIAFVPQFPLLPRDMTVYEYVLLGRNPYIKFFSFESKNDQAIVKGILKRLSLLTLASRTLDTLSGGERQRLVIARALAQEAPVLLLDEPTSALDIGHQQNALELIDSIRRENNICVVSAMHDLTLAGLYADRLLLMHQGFKVAHGTASEVLRPEILFEFYGVNASVHQQSDGTIAVIPKRT